MQLLQHVPLSYHCTLKQVQVEAIREQLEAEFAALEAANVHAILDSAAAVPTVVKKIDVALSKLEDLELTLDVFDGKLSAMREDIGTIESRNNNLETQTRSLERLQRAIKELLSVLTVRFRASFTCNSVSLHLTAAQRALVTDEHMQHSPLRASHICLHLSVAVLLQLIGMNSSLLSGTSCFGSYYVHILIALKVSQAEMELNLCLFVFSSIKFGRLGVK
jgi:cell division FtsZ-interacting protein ZapD